MPTQLAEEEERGIRRRVGKWDGYAFYIRVEEQGEHKGMDMR